MRNFVFSSTHRKLILFAEIEMSTRSLAAEVGEVLEEPRNELRRELLGLHAPLRGGNDTLVVLLELRDTHKHPFLRGGPKTLETLGPKTWPALPRREKGCGGLEEEEEGERYQRLVFGLVEALAVLVELLDVVGFLRRRGHGRRRERGGEGFWGDWDQLARFRVWVRLFGLGLSKLITWLRFGYTKKFYIKFY